MQSPSKHQNVLATTATKEETNVSTNNKVRGDVESGLSPLVSTDMSIRNKIRTDVKNFPPTMASDESKSFPPRVQCEYDLVKMDHSTHGLHLSFELNHNFSLAQKLLKGAETRDAILKSNGKKQTHHIRGTDGWMKSMCAMEERAIDNIMIPVACVSANAVVCTVLYKIVGIDFNYPHMQHWESVYSLVLKTSLAFLLVFRLNRVAVRYWETRTMWGNVTLSSRSLVGGIMTHCSHSIENRDAAICWVGAFCVSAMHFIRRERDIPSEELAGFLSRSQIDKMQRANHPPLYVTSQIRHYLRKALDIKTIDVSMQETYARAIHLNYLEKKIDNLISQISGMERIRSTPLPVVYVTHLRTFLFFYLLFLPYLWVSEWGWGAVPLVCFTAFALFGIEGASSECEIPFNKDRPNHLALDAYCAAILGDIQGLVLHEANIG